MRNKNAKEKGEACRSREQSLLADDGGGSVKRAEDEAETS